MNDNTKKYRRSAVSIACYVVAVLMLFYVIYMAGNTVSQINQYYAQYDMKAQPMEYVTYILQTVLEPLINAAIFFMFGYVLDEVRKNIQALPIDDRFVRGGQTLYGVTDAQKQGLLDGFGISRMQDDGGYLNVKLGFSGYNSVRTKNYPNGQPNSVIARSVNSGTSFRQRNPFVDNAVANARSQAEEKMKQKFDEACGDVMN